MIDKCECVNWVRTSGGFGLKHHPDCPKFNIKEELLTAVSNLSRDIIDLSFRVRYLEKGLRELELDQKYKKFGCDDI